MNDARRKRRILATAIVLMTLIAYFPVSRAGFIWDDDDYIENNPVLLVPEGLIDVWLAPMGVVPQYYPLVFTSFWVEYRLWGLDPLGYHVVNVALHAANALLLALAMRRLGMAGAWAAAAVFAVHPVFVESAAWITERKNVLSTCFYLLALLSYLRSLDGGTRRQGAWWAALGLFVAALLSKTVTCSLPAAILLILWWRKGRLGWRDVRPLAPFFIAGLALGALTAWMEKYNVGVRGQEWHLSLAERGLIAGRALCFYAGKLGVPAPLAFFYPRWTLDATAWWQWLYPSAAAAVVISLWAWRRRLGRGPLTAALLFAGTLAPALGFFDVYPMRYSFVADHFQYLAALALVAPVVAWSAGLAARMGGRSRRTARHLFAALVVCFGALTWGHAEAFRDRKTLWQDTLRKNPTAWFVQTNMSSEMAERGRPFESIAHADMGLAINPRDAGAYNNRGLAYESLGAFDQAIRDYTRSIEIKPERNVAVVYANRGNTYLGMGDYAAAVADCDTAVALVPGYPRPYYIRALARYSLKDYNGAWADVHECLALRGDVHPGFLQALRAASGRTW